MASFALLHRSKILEHLCGLGQAGVESGEMRCDLDNLVDQAVKKGARAID